MIVLQKLPFLTIYMVLETISEIIMAYFRPSNLDGRTPVV